MASLPTGTITFLFTDIEGSTRLLQELGDRYADVLATHHRLLCTAIQEAQGQVVDTQGDAVFNLPIQLTSFIGRAREIAEVKRLLGAARFVTLIGSGGAGKTRLALQVAAEVVEG
jgi:class 3 adenylate cyclase